MRVGFDNLYIYNTKRNYNRDDVKTSNTVVQNTTMPNFYYPLINFTSLKKSAFSGTDRLAVEKFNAPIQTFKTKEDMDRWADKQSEKFLSAEYKGKTEITANLRRSTLDDWQNYFSKSDNEYSPAEKLLISEGLVKELKPNNDDIPLPLNKGALAKTIGNLRQELEQNPKKKEYSFKNAYLTNLRHFYMEDMDSNDGSQLKWVVIPSEKNDPDNFKSNVQKLKVLSHRTWCTKTDTTSLYLGEGDFHILLRGSDPVLSIKFSDNTIDEVQGIKNNWKIPLDYYESFQEHIEGKNYELSEVAKNQIEIVEKAKEMLPEVKKEIGDAILEKDSEKILNYFGMKTKKLKDGTLELSHFCRPKKGSYEDFGIDESELLKNVSIIKGDADFACSPMKKLEHIKKIGGNADFSSSNIESLGELEKIGRGASFTYSNIKDLGELKEIKGPAYFYGTEIETLGKLTKVGGDVDIRKTPCLKDFGNIEEVGGSIFIRDTKLEKFEKLKRIGKDLTMEHNNITSLGSIEEIGENFYHSYGLNNLGNLRKVGGNFVVKNAKLDTLGQLEIVGGKLAIWNSTVADYGAIRVVNGEISMKDSVEKEKVIETIKKNGGEYKGI